MMKKLIEIGGCNRLANVTPRLAREYIQISVDAIGIKAIGAEGDGMDFMNLLGNIFNVSGETVFTWLEAETDERSDDILREIKKLTGATLHRGHES